MTKIDIKPLSVNKAWRGKRFKTDFYKSYEEELLWILPKNIKVYPKLTIEFGLSSTLSDIDNPVKPFIDVLQKKYGFNDKDIDELHLYKKIVKKGQEYIDFEFSK